MLVGYVNDFPNFGDADERSPKGFYRQRSEEIWPEIDPYMMTRAELDEQIKAGVKLYQKYFPGGDGMGLFTAVCIVVVIAAVAYATAGTGTAAAGSASAASSGSTAAGASATASASSAAAAGSTGAGAATSSSASFGAQAFGWAKKVAPYAKAAGAAAKASGKDSEGDKLIKGANAVENSDNVTDAGTQLFKDEMNRREMEFEGKNSEEALRTRMQREQQSYAQWMRREAEKKKQQDPQVQTTGQNQLKTWLPIATPFILIALSGRY